MRKLFKGRGLGLLAAVVGWSATAWSAPTHQLVRPFETVVSGQTVSLPVGTEVEANSGDGKSFMVRHTLPGGSTTLLFIPTASLKPLEMPTEPVEPTVRQVVPPPPSAPQNPASVPVSLTTKDGRTVEGRILRVEKRTVVVDGGSEGPMDLPLKGLDQPSQDRVTRWKTQFGGKPPEPDPRVVAGKKIELVFPDLGASRSSDPTRIQIRIPESYEPGKPVPLLLYLGGGEGTDNCDEAGAFVDPREWVLVAFPYPASAPRPRGAAHEGKSRDLIAFQEPLLERLQALVPNTDPARRVVVGFSNGAHMIGMAVCDGWKDFSAYFSAFVLHEGGASGSGDFSALRKKQVFVGMGEKSSSLDFAALVADKIKKARAKPTVFVAPDEAHELGHASREAIKDWIAKLPAG